MLIGFNYSFPSKSPSYFWKAIDGWGGSFPLTYFVEESRISGHGLLAKKSNINFFMDLDSVLL